MNLQTVTVSTAGGRYPVHIGREILPMIGPWVKEASRGRRILLVSHPRLCDLYGQLVTTSLQDAGFRVETALVAPGERSKSLTQAGRLYRQAVAAGLDRRSLVMALGGGVVGDLAGFVAATYMRGVEWVAVPTSLLAQVDASVGGKVAVDLPEGKNLVGAFHQPLLVTADVGVLASLPMREIRCGLAEVIKHGAILDAALFERLAGALADGRGSEGLAWASGRRLSWEVVEHCVMRSCALKGEVVEQDEREGGLRALLNFGHTVGHALEALMGYRRLRHGEAVAVGMVTEGLISRRVLGLPQADVHRMREVIELAGLPAGWPPVEPDAVLQAMGSDKKFVEGKARLALLRELGRAEVVGVTEADIRAALEEHREADW